MKRARIEMLWEASAAVLCLVLQLVLATSARASATATQVVTMEVLPICAISVSGNPTKLVVAPPGVTAPGTASSSDSSTYVRYTAITPKGRVHAMTAHTDSPSPAPSGCSLRLEAIRVTGISCNAGTPTGQIVLNNTPKAIIQGIGSCATGTGPTDGAQLSYSLVVDDPSQLVPGEKKTAVITLSITDAS